MDEKILKLPTYNNKEDYQNTHPSVLFFEHGWNGYPYWMSVTPYENENADLENPCILVSEDGVSWKEPRINLNPLVKTPSKRFYHYSDPHLVCANNTLELWYRKRTKKWIPANREILLRKVSSDGIRWSRPETLHVSEKSGVMNRLSPCVIFDEGKYRIWVSNFNEKVLEYFESASGRHWVKMRDIRIEAYDTDKYVWHMDIKRTPKGYEMYYCAGSSYRCDTICYASSPDNISWSTPVPVFKGVPGRFDEMLYRPSFVDLSDGRRAVYYGGFKDAGHSKAFYIGVNYL